MNKTKLVLLVAFNLFFAPIYLFLFIFCAILSFIPIFPTRVAKQNLIQRLEVKGIKANYFIALIYLNYVFYFFEAFVFEPLNLNICVFDKSFNFFEAMLEIKKNYPLAQERGCVFILSHMANVEMYTIPVLEGYKKSTQTKVYALAQPSSSEIVNKLLTWYRVRPGMGVIWTDNKLFSKMEKAIVNERSSLSMLIDQKPKKGGLFVRFFGEFAAFPTSGLRMCLNHNMVVVYAAGYRIIPGYLILKLKCGKNSHLNPENKKHELSLYTNTDHIVPSEVFNPEKIKEREKDVALEISYFVGWLEKAIREHPCQWSWDYKKWSRKPQAD